MIFRKSPNLSVVAPEAPSARAPEQPPAVPTGYPRGSLGPAIHAKRLVLWCQERNIIGAVESKDLYEKHYPAMCRELGWQPEGWRLVAREARLFLGLPPKQTRYVRGGYRIVMMIPPLVYPVFDEPTLPEARTLMPTEAKPSQKH